MSIFFNAFCTSCYYIFLHANTTLECTMLMPKVIEALAENILMTANSVNIYLERILEIPVMSFMLCQNYNKEEVETLWYDVFNAHKEPGLR